MRRTIPAVVAILLLVGALAAVPAAMAQETDTATDTTETETVTETDEASETDTVTETTETEENETEIDEGETEENETETDENETEENNTVPPGAQLSGVVGVGEAELSGDVESRAYGIRVAQAASNDSKAGVLKDQLNRTEQRLAEIESQREELEAARENDSISQGEYRSRLAKLHAESRTVQQLANQTNETASGLPDETLEANGVNATAIRTLSQNARNLSGPEVAAIARGIAGNDVGRSPGPPARAGTSRGPTGERGPQMTDRGPSGERGPQMTARGPSGERGPQMTDRGPQTDSGPDTATDNRTDEESSARTDTADTQETTADGSDRGGSRSAGSNGGSSAGGQNSGSSNGGR